MSRCSDKSTAYTYAALQYKEIRVLDLLPGDFGAPLTGVLLHVPLPESAHDSLQASDIDEEDVLSNSSSLEGTEATGSPIIGKMRNWYSCGTSWLRAWVHQTLFHEMNTTQCRSA